MTKEEQLKIYSAYLPYDLSFENTVTHSIYRLKTINKRTDGFVRMEFSNAKISISDFIEDEDGNKMNFKPILYPLEYLTKEIEHEGKTITPIEEIAKDLEMNAAEYMFLTANVGSQEFDWLRTATYPVVQKMLEYHLNVFSLPEDHFINKATLTNKN